MAGQWDGRTKVTELSIASLSIFVAICLAIIAVLVTRPGFQVGLNAFTLAGGALLFAVLLFLFANDFFLLMIFHSKNEFFGVAGSALYVLGEILMVIGISISLKALTTPIFGSLFLIGFTLGFITYNALRIWQVGLESPVKTRLTLRAVSLAILILGYFAIFKI
jgi:hypothetical protein